jgi:hypothetical protein
MRGPRTPLAERGFAVIAIEPAQAMLWLIAKATSPVDVSRAVPRAVWAVAYSDRVAHVISGF